jgi:hypothetical protein
MIYLSAMLKKENPHFIKLVIAVPLVLLLDVDHATT